MKKNITRRLMTALLAAVMCVSMAACGSKTDDTKTDGTGDADGAKKYTIGVCQLVTHDALDAATQGFIDAVKDKLGEENVTIDVQNAANDQNVCTTIVNTFVSKKVDLIMANQHRRFLHRDHRQHRSERQDPGGSRREGHLHRLRRGYAVHQLL